MKYFDTSIDIAAPPEVVWGIVTDAEALPSWDSGIDRVEGAIEPGGKLKLFVEANPGRGFPIKVAEFTPPHRMVWSGGMPFGLLKGIRTYSLTPEGPVTRFRMREEFSGPMLPLIWRSMPNMQPSFDQYAAGLKAEAERRRELGLQK